jgi:rhodanese-related sulfurtransferase
MINEISVEEFKKTSEKFFIIDVREAFELVQDGKIPNSIHIPLGELTYEKVISANPEKKPFLIYCRSGRRSMTACDMLDEEDENLELYNLKGGILAYKSA